MDAGRLQLADRGPRDDGRLRLPPHLVPEALDGPQRRARLQFLTCNHRVPSTAPIPMDIVILGSAQRGVTGTTLTGHAAAKASPADVGPVLPEQPDRTGHGPRTSEGSA
ncbi:hypothetical protein ACFFX0_19400 [Citricoccus parietis]|uniref:Uncharacterized protein n=1 Tax=Citricoccus parietis TaxID=592307 RepID=A0ABV5G2T9_9MICC